MKEDFDWAKRDAIPAMRDLLRKGIPTDVDNPLNEAVAGGYEQAIEYARVEREKYVAEVGKRDGNYIYHFYPRTEDLLPTFGDKLGDAMVEVFKKPERLSSKHDEVMRCFEGEELVQRAESEGTPTPILCRFWGSPEEFEKGCPNCGSQKIGISMSSWAVRAAGFALNPMADEMAVKVFDVLDRLLSQ